MIQIVPVTLEGRWVRLEPMRLGHLAGLTGVALDPEIWRFMPVLPSDDADMERWVLSSLANADAGAELPFVQIERSSGSIVGSTRLMDIRPEHDGVEIGYTWLGRRWWRTPVNSEAKYLLLSHLFDTVGCIRVALKTDLLNERSQRAIERLGAIREGVLRRHMIVQGGRFRDTVYYSILNDEWPAIRSRMFERLYGAESGDL